MIKYLLQLKLGHTPWEVIQTAKETFESICERKCEMSVVIDYPEPGNLEYKFHRIKQLDLY